MAGTPGRFTIIRALGVTASAIARRPASLAAIVAVNLMTTAAISAGEAAWLGQTGPTWAMARAVGSLVYALNDATVGLAAVTVALEGLAGERPDPARTARRTWKAFGPALLIGVLTCLPAMSYELAGEADWTWAIDLAALLGTVVVACTIGLAPFAAVAGRTGLGAALARSLALSRLARWRLAWLGVLTSLTSGIGNEVSWSMASAFSGRPLVQEAVSQAIYTVWYMATVLVSVGVGVMLTRVALDRDPDDTAALFD